MNQLPDYIIRQSLSSLADIVRKIKEYPFWFSGNINHAECVLFELRKVLIDVNALSKKFSLDYQDIKPLELLVDLANNILYLSTHFLDTFSDNHHIYNSSRYERRPSLQFTRSDKFEGDNNSEIFENEYLNLSAHDKDFTISPFKCKRSNFSKEVVKILNSWLKINKHYPFPTSAEKNKLISLTRLSKKQLNDWFTNARRRKLNKKH
jgi:hypothetical protein